MITVDSDSTLVHWASITPTSVFLVSTGWKIAGEINNKYSRLPVKSASKKLEPSSFAPLKVDCIKNTGSEKNNKL